MSVLADITNRVNRYAGRAALPDHTIGSDLEIDRGDFVELFEEIEAAYAIDLRSLFEPTGEFRDATVQELAEYVSENRRLM